MWWFIVTFVAGLTVGRKRWLPAAFLQRPQWFVFPSLCLLLIALGYQIGGQRSVLAHFPELGGQALAIAVFAMAGSAVCAFLTSLFCLRSRSKRHKHPDMSAEEHSP